MVARLRVGFELGFVGVVVGPCYPGAARPPPAAGPAAPLPNSPAIFGGWDHRAPPPSPPPPALFFRRPPSSATPCAWRPRGAVFTSTPNRTAVAAAVRLRRIREEEEGGALMGPPTSLGG
ncbi:hypothetical protein ZWY2020_007098 [Hordeum vulgare]|nr:hypothetical protein ZWY2020_007098 [Hordeum vulgare]